MASLYITEYGGISLGANGAQAPEEPPLAEQKLTIGASSVASAAFNAGTQLVCLHADAICSVKFGTAADVALGINPTATAASRRLNADTDRYFGVNGGMKVAVITNS